MTNKVYDAMKWAALAGLPALAVFTSTVGAAWGIPNTEPISITIVAGSVLLGTWVGVSGVNYKKGKHSE